MGQVLLPSPSGEAVDHKHAIGPDDDLPRSTFSQPKGFDCSEELGSCNRLVSAMQNACSASQCVNQATVEGRRKKEEGRRKKEEGRRKKEEGRRKKEEGRSEH